METKRAYGDLNDYFSMRSKEIGVE